MCMADQTTQARTTSRSLRLPRSTQATSSLPSKTSSLVCGPVSLRFYIPSNVATEIYRIVSSKALDQGEGGGAMPTGERKVLEISKSTDDSAKKGGCC